MVKDSDKDRQDYKVLAESKRVDKVKETKEQTGKIKIESRKYREPAEMEIDLFDLSLHEGRWPG